MPTLNWICFVMGILAFFIAGIRAHEEKEGQAILEAVFAAVLLACALKGHIN